MAILQLTPRVYGKSMQWKISPSNIIETVSTDPIINAVSTDSENLKTYTYTKVSDYSGSKTATLPLGTSIPEGWLLNELTYARNYRTNLAWGASGEPAKARVDSIGARVAAEIILDNPVEGLPQATVSVTGKSYIIGRGSLGYNSYPSWDSLKNVDFDLGAWIYENRTTQQEYLQANYDKKLPLMPFVSSDGYNVGRVFSSTKDPVYSDYWCKFNKGYAKGSSQGAEQDAWTTGYGSPKTRTVYPENWNGNFDGRATLPDVTQELVVTLKQGIDKYHYTLNVDVPVRVAWAAASQTFNEFSQPAFLDSFAFLDLVTEINVTLAGRPYNTDDVVYNYSLDSNGNLTDTNVKEDNIYKVENCELITVPTTMNGQPWTSEMSKTLLNKYKKGKYIVTAQVPAKWAILNNVHINTQIQVTTLNGEYIARNGTICTFEVKSIIKHFEGSTFYYRLQLMEV